MNFSSWIASVTHFDICDVLGVLFILITTTVIIISEYLYLVEVINMLIVKGNLILRNNFVNYCFFEFW